MSRLLQSLFRLPFIIVVTYTTQQAARSRRPDLRGGKALGGSPPATRRYFHFR